MVASFKKFHADDTGFTLLEMLIVLFVIGLLLLIIIPNVTQHQESSQEKGDEALQSTLQTQVDLYRMDNREEVPTFDLLESTNYLNEKQAAEARDKFTISASGQVVYSP